MAFVVIYWIFVAGTLGASWALGDRHSRVLIAGAALAAVASFAVFLFEKSAAEVLLGTIDSMLLALALYVAMTTDRFWPIWFAGFQLAAILTRVAAAWATTDTRWLFVILESFWVIPCLLSMVLGLVRDRGAVAGAARNNRFVT